MPPHPECFCINHDGLCSKSTHALSNFLSESLFKEIKMYHQNVDCLLFYTSTEDSTSFWIISCTVIESKMSFSIV